MTSKQIQVEVLRGFRWEGAVFQPKTSDDPDIPPEPLIIRLPEDIARELAAAGKVKLLVEPVRPVLAGEPTPSPATLWVRVLRAFRLNGDPVEPSAEGEAPKVFELHAGLARQLIASGKAELAPEPEPAEAPAAG